VLYFLDLENNQIADGGAGALAGTKVLSFLLLLVQKYLRTGTKARTKVQILTPEALLQECCRSALRSLIST
jgi:hypothetical protein